MYMISILISSSTNSLSSQFVTVVNIAQNKGSTLVGSIRVLSGLYMVLGWRSSSTEPGFGHQDKSSVISKASKGKDLASNPRK